MALATGSWLFIAAFLGVSCWIYFSPNVNYGQFLASFLVFLFLPAFFHNVLSPDYFFLVSFVYAALFFVFLGVKNLIFINRQPIYSFINGVLMLAIFSLFFWIDKTNIFFFVKYLLAFAVFFFVFKEFISFSFDNPGEQKKKMFVWTISFLLFQIVWALSFLPINFLNAAALALLIVLIFEDFIGHHFNGTIDRQVVLRNLTVFILLSLAIFGASK